MESHKDITGNFIAYGSQNGHNIYKAFCRRLLCDPFDCLRNMLQHDYCNLYCILIIIAKKDVHVEDDNYIYAIFDIAFAFLYF